MKAAATCTIKGRKIETRNSFEILDSRVLNLLDQSIKMGRYSTKTMFLIMLLHILISSSSETRSDQPIVNGVCASEFKDLNVCKAFNGIGNTCCSASRMQMASLPVKNQAQKCYDKVFEACSDAYCSSNASNEVIVPCGTNEGTICETASQGMSIGKQFWDLWDAAGLIFQTADNSTEATWGQTMFELIEIISITGIVRSFIEVILRRLL